MISKDFLEKVKLIGGQKKGEGKRGKRQGAPISRIEQAIRGGPYGLFIRQERNCCATGKEWEEGRGTGKRDRSLSLS